MRTTLEPDTLLQYETQFQVWDTPPDSRASLRIQDSEPGPILEARRHLNSALDLDMLLHLILQLAAQATSTDWDDASYLQPPKTAE